MSYAAKRISLQAHVATYFTSLAADKIAWDNVDFTVPNNTPWARVSIQNNISNYASVGKTKIARREGFIFIQVFTPNNSETDELLTIIDNVVSIFETHILPGITFFSPSVREIGNTETWFQTNISVPFYYDETVTGV